MGKGQDPGTKADELRQATRAANEALGDLKRLLREVVRLIDTAFEERIAANVEQANRIISRHLDEFLGGLKKHNDALQEALIKRWSYIETMCVADHNIAQLVAMYVLRDSGGTVETKQAKYHLVQERAEPDGSATFAFPPTMAWQGDNDPQAQEAIRAAVRKHRPDIELFPWRTDKLRGADDK